MRKNHSPQEIVSFNHDVADVIALIELDDQALERVSGGVQTLGCTCNGQLVFNCPTNKCGINDICGVN